MSAASPATEVDLLKRLALRSPDPKATLRQYLKLWVAITKFLKAQCDKGRLVDSKIFGQFYKGRQGSYKFVPASEILEKTAPKVNSDLEIIPPRKVSQSCPELLNCRSLR